MTHDRPSGRFYSLDVLRGVAALSVVFWHWQNFFLPLNKQGVKFFMGKLPLFDVLAMFYKHGSEAVLLFFSLSGFIFYWLYSDRVAQQAITAKSFAVLRFSRLYPLHFATLLFVAVAQFVYAGGTRSFFVYPANDLYHFVLNLFFASSWGLERGLSYNAPIWSVSVEVLLYAMFFVSCRLVPRNMVTLGIAVILGHFLVPRVNTAIASGVECFLLGGMVYLVYEWIVATGDAWRVTIWLPVVSAMAWLVAMWSVSQVHGIVVGEGPWMVRKAVAVWPVFVLFPATILSLALLETKRGTLGRRLSFVGDISYSTYLLHFPLQLAVVLVFRKIAIRPALFYSPWFMAAFFVTLVLAALAVHRYFEVPMQRFLRRQRGPRIDTEGTR